MALVVFGCAPNRAEHLPTYHWTDAQTALGIMRQRALSVRTVSAQCQIELTRSNNQSIRLDGVLVMAPPQKSVHLRAWKMNQPVFDLTLIPRGLWVEAPRDQGSREKVVPASLSAAQVTKALSLMSGELFEGSDLRIIDRGGPTFEVRKPIDRGQSVSAQVDRAALVVRRYQLLDPTGATRFSLSMDKYQEISGIVWPMRLVAMSDTGKIELDFRDVELNVPLPDHAFDPPPRAEKAG